MIIYETDRLILKTLSEKDASSLFIYFSKNKNFLEPWESERAPFFYSSAYMKHWIRKDNKQIADGQMLRMWIYKKDNSSSIIGSVGIANIEPMEYLAEYENMENNNLISVVEQKKFQKATLGYRLDRDFINRGYITEAILKMVDISFNELDLQLLEANIASDNTASIRAIEKCNFSKKSCVKEGVLLDGKLKDYCKYIRVRD